MNKTAISCLLAASAAGMLWAASDRIYIVEDGCITKRLNVDEIESIYYSKDTDGDKYHNMEVNFKNGTLKTFPLASVETMSWYKSLPDCPVTIDIMPRYESARLTVTSSEPGVYYRISGMPEKYLEQAGIDESIWAETLMDSDIEYIYAVAESYGMPLSYFKMETIFETGDQVRDWFPSVIIRDNTPIAMVVYTARLEGDEVVPTSEPTLMRFSTRKLEIEDIDFDISADLTSNTMVVKGDAPEGWDSPFYVTAFTEEQVLSESLESLVNSSVASLENMVYNYGHTWDEVTHIGHGESTLSNLLMGDVYYAVAFGLDYGIVTTTIKSKKFTIPEPVATDDCTFSVNAVQKSPAEFMLSVTPSNADTRYAGMLVETSRFNDEYTPEMAIAKEIKYRNYTNTINWSDSDLVFSGEAELSTQASLLDGKYLNVGTDYTVLIFGVDGIGTRTTAIERVDITPQSTQGSELTFDVSFGEFDDSGMTHYLTVNVTPSDPDARYVIDCYKADNNYVDLSRTDDQFISEYIRVMGTWLELKSGDLSKKLSLGSTWDSSVGAYVYKDYILFIFGYDGEATTPLYAYRINSETGEAVQVRGPEDNSLSFAITAGDFDASSSRTHFLPVTVTPSDHEAKYVFEYLPESNWAVDLSKTDEEFISDYVSVQGQYLELRTGESSRILTMGSDWDSGFGAYLFKPYILFIFGYDGEATSPLYLFRVDSETGSIEQIRGPGVE